MTNENESKKSIEFKNLSSNEVNKNIKELNEEVQEKEYEIEGKKANELKKEEKVMEKNKMDLDINETEMKEKLESAKLREKENLNKAFDKNQKMGVGEKMKFTEEEKGHERQIEILEEEKQNLIEEKFNQICVNKRKKCIESEDEANEKNNLNMEKRQKLEMMRIESKEDTKENSSNLFSDKENEGDTKNISKLDEFNVVCEKAKLEEDSENKDKKENETEKEADENKLCGVQYSDFFLKETQIFPILLFAVHKNISQKKECDELWEKLSEKERKEYEKNSVDIKNVLAAVQNKNFYPAKRKFENKNMHPADLFFAYSYDFLRENFMGFPDSILYDKCEEIYAEETSASSSIEKAFEKKILDIQYNRVQNKLKGMKCKTTEKSEDGLVKL